MKKILLTAVVAFASMAMFAQTIPYSEYQIDGNSSYKGDTLYQRWDAHKRNSAPGVKLGLLDFSTNLLVSEDGGIGDGADATNGGNGKNGGGKNVGKWYVSSPYIIKWNSSEKALQIDANINTEETNYSEVSLSWLNNTQVGTTSWDDYDPFTQETDSVVGAMIDLTEQKARRALIKYKIKSESDCDTVNIRMDLGDANGRVSNYQSPHHPVGKDVNNQYQIVEFFWNNSTAGRSNDYDAKTMQDGYTQKFFNSGNGRNANNPYSSAMFIKYGNGAKFKLGDETGFELDESRIGKVVLGFNDDMRSTADNGCGPKFTIYIKEIQIGDQEENAYTITSTKDIASAKNTNLVTPNVGRDFKFQGTGVMVDVLGKQVAQGVDGISAKAIGAGVYYIIVDGVASRVVVK